VLAVLLVAAVFVRVPAATLETTTAQVPLAVSSWCAGTKCGAPLGSETRAAVAKRGTVVTLRLGFAPRTVSVSVGGTVVRTSRSGRQASWTATRAGGITVTATGPSLSVTYVGRLLVR
jgi:hypothetical protein